MTSHGISRTALLVVVCLLVSSGYVATHYEGWRYEGGPIRNHGLLTRPRFEAPFPPIRFDQSGSYDYFFSRFPAGDAYVQLTPPDGLAPEAIKLLTTQIRIRVADENDRSLCDATGSPAGTGTNQLVVTSSTSVIGLYLVGCARLDLRACPSCRLSVAVSHVDPATPAILLTPTLLGGGLELP